MIEDSLRAKRRVHLLWCDAEATILEARLRSRKGGISDAGPHLYKQQLAEFEDFTLDEKTFMTRVDTERPIDIDALAKTLMLTA